MEVGLDAGAEDVIEAGEQWLVLCEPARLMAVRQATPVWGTTRLGLQRAPPDGVSLTMFAACTVWFTLNAVAEVRALVAPGAGRSSLVDLAVFVAAFAFPPLIMHVVYRETSTDCTAPRGRWWGWLLAGMYVISPLAGIYLVQDGEFRFLNTTAASYADYEARELIGQKSGSFIHPEDRERVKADAQ